MADYTWVGRSRERHFDSHNHVTSDRQEAWETIILDGVPFRRMLEQDGQPLPPEEQRKQQQKLDKSTARLENETPPQKQRRAADYEKERRREREFLLEIPDAYDLRLEGGRQRSTAAMCGSFRVCPNLGIARRAGTARRC